MDAGLAELIDELTALLQAGGSPDLEEFVSKHPEHAAKIRELWPALELLQYLDPPSDVTDTAGFTPGVLGDYRLVREVGRGGMGVVYEAEQISLNRAVALKILPFAATIDPKQLQRFQNEARAAASLHHEHIVPVYGVGCERGVHYYAMQFIAGRSLSELIVQLKKEQTECALASTESTAPVARAATVPDFGGGGYWRRMAELIAQAADALEYAHSLGVVHRDVKPGNLLLDGRGSLWVADFGLAKFGADVGVTMTGDLLGTLRYMSPEQALAKHGLVDHRTDVYSLGATLYELLTLKPAFAATDRQELLRQIAFEEPAPPRRVNPAVPVELETITLKAMAKDPAERYATAHDLADDLRRWLADEPIRARRPTAVQHLRRWSRRHRPLLWSAGVSLVATVAALGGAAGWVLRDRADRQMQAAEALDLAVQLERQGKWPDAWAVLERVETLLGTGGGERLRGRAREVRVDLEMVRKLEEARLEGIEWRKVDFDWKHSADRMAAAFRDYGIDVEALDPAASAEQVRSRNIHTALAAGLDHWARARRRHPSKDGKDWKDLMRLSLAADPNPWRERLWRAWETDDRDALFRVAKSEIPADLPPATVVLLASALHELYAHEIAATVLSRAQQRHPGDFWVNYALGCSLAGLGPTRSEEAVRYHSIAVALRPESAGAHFNLGLVLYDMDRLDEAIAEFRETVRLKPDFANAHNILGNALFAAGRLGEAIAAQREALRIAPRYVNANIDLGEYLDLREDLKGAAAHYLTAAQVQPNHPRALHLYGWAIERLGDRPGAIEAYRRALTYHPEIAQLHYSLGDALRRQDRAKEAIPEYEEAIRLEPNHLSARKSMAYAWRLLGQTDKAISDYEECIRRGPEFAPGLNSFAWLLATTEDLHYRDPARAVDLAQQAVDLHPRNANYLNTLGVAHYRNGNFMAAVIALENAKEIEDDCCDYLFLAMAHWQLGDKELAFGWLDRGIQALTNPGQHCDKDELSRFRIEAETVLGLRKK